MTASNQQCFQAKMFLTVYQDAVKTLQQILGDFRQSALNKKDKKQYNKFLQAFLKIRKNNQLHKLIHPSLSYSILYKQQPKYGAETLKNIKLFQYSHYLFLKYLSSFDSFKGDSSSLLAYIKEGNMSIQKEIKRVIQLKKI